MDEIEELMYKVIDEDYDLTERDKNYLTISSFVLAKEKIIKKDIPKKKVYFDCNKQEYIPLIIELGNIIKNQIVKVLNIISIQNDLNIKKIFLI